MHAVNQKARDCTYKWRNTTKCHRFGIVWTKGFLSEAFRERFLRSARLWTSYHYAPIIWQRTYILKVLIFTGWSNSKSGHAVLAGDLQIPNWHHSITLNLGFAWVIPWIYQATFLGSFLIVVKEPSCIRILGYLGWRKTWKKCCICYWV